MKSRRHFLKVSALSGAGTALGMLSSSSALGASASEVAKTLVGDGPVTNLVLTKSGISIDDRVAAATIVNGSLPGPVLRYREGETVTIQVANKLAETSSIHWHGLIVPPEMDGVPGVSFPGIRPGETFIYRFRLRQNGTYWYHSHSGNQEQGGLYGPLIIDPIKPDPYTYDSEIVVMLSDWTFEDPARVLAKMKKFGSYYNFNRRTMGDVFRDASRDGWRAMFADRLEWAKMRMDPTDIADVTGATYTYLFNGRSANQNWTTLFKPGERIRVRFINAGAMTHFDVRIPGLSMTLVQADGQNVEPVTVEEFRIAPAETYDMIVQPGTEEAYTIFAESMDRSGYVAGTLARRQGQRAPVPTRRVRPLRTMADMGMSGDSMASMSMPAAMGKEPTQMLGNAGVAGAKSAMPGAMSGSPKSDMADMAMPPGLPPAKPDMSMPAGSKHTMPDREMLPNQAPPMAKMTMPADTEIAAGPSKQSTAHGPDRHGPGNSTTAEMPVSRVSEPGSGLGDAGRRVLVYGDLRRLDAGRDGIPEREIELHITGNMERQIWGFDGKKYSEAKEPILFAYGQRLRVTLVNDTMMDHPMHLHGMWMVLENGGGAKRPLKHTINVKAGERLSFDVEPDEVGQWAFHCHLLIHMELGMFRVVSVKKQESTVLK